MTATAAASAQYRLPSQSQNQHRCSTGGDLASGTESRGGTAYSRNVIGNLKTVALPKVKEIDHPEDLAGRGICERGRKVAGMSPHGSCRPR